MRGPYFQTYRRELLSFEKTDSVHITEDANVATNEEVECTEPINSSIHPSLVLYTQAF